MLGRLLPLLLIFHSLQDACVMGDFPTDSGNDGIQSGKDQLRKADEVQSPQNVGNGLFRFMVPNNRQRRHIGSVAAFRGFPEKITQQPSAYPNWSAIMNRNLVPATISDQEPINSIDEIMKNKRYPAVQVAMRTSETAAQQYNEAKMMAANGLLRLMLMGRYRSGVQPSIKSKKFIGSLARNNAIPYKTRVSSKQNQGAAVIASPRKKSLLTTKLDGQPLMLSPQQMDDIDNVLFPAQDGSPDVYDDYDEEDYLTDETESEVWVPSKRHIGSVVKTGWYQPSIRSNSSARAPKETNTF